MPTPVTNRKFCSTPARHFKHPFRWRSRHLPSLNATRTATSRWHGRRRSTCPPPSKYCPASYATSTSHGNTSAVSTCISCRPSMRQALSSNKVRAFVLLSHSIITFQWLGSGWSREARAVNACGRDVRAPRGAQRIARRDRVTRSSTPLGLCNHEHSRPPSRPQSRPQSRP